jgi:hypothetical protein
VGFFVLSANLMLALSVNLYEIYSPVVKPIPIRAVLSSVVSKSWCIKQVDASSAFLHSHLQETVYVLTL